MGYENGDRVRVDIPDVDDPDHRYHGEVGTVEEVLEDDLSGITDDPVTITSIRSNSRTRRSVECPSGITTSGESIGRLRDVI